MKKTLKKAISLLMSIVLVATLIPANAANPSAVQDAEKEVTYNATNSLGEILTTAMEENFEESNGYFIQEVTVDELTAEANISAPDGTTLVVAIYDEESGEMITSGKASVNADTETTNVSLGECDMPEFFVVKAFLLDENNAPVCQNYEGLSYTEAYQEFLSKTTDDFDEEKVINLDSGKESNFAVVSDDTIVVKQTLGANTVVTDDYENGIYTFKNPDDELKSLKIGDVLYYVYGDGPEDYILIKIGDIDTEGNEITFTADDDAEIGELFSYIKIDTAEAVYEDPVMSGAKIDDEAGKDDYSKEKSFKVDAEYKKYKDDSNSNNKSNIYIKFTGELKFKIELKFYYDFKLFKDDYYELSHTITTTFTGDTTIEAEAKAEFEPIELFHGGIPIYTGVEAEILVLVKITFSASVNVSGGIEFKMVNGAKQISSKPKQDLSKSPTVELKFEVEGKVQFDLTPSVTVGIKIVKVFKISLSAEAKFSITASAKSEMSSDDVNSYYDVLHGCTLCIDGDIKVEVSVKIKFEFGIKGKKAKPILTITPVKITRKLGDFYISFLPEDNGKVKFHEFGWGECPFVKYKVTFNVVDENQKPLKNVEISDDVNVVKTDSNGKAYCYYTDGTYSFTAKLDGYQINKDLMTYGELVFVVSDETVTVNIYMKKSSDSGDTDTPTKPETPSNPDTPTNPSDPESPNESGILDSGICGENLTWTLYNDGELVISGTGDMTNYSSDYNVPWNNYRRKIKTVTLDDKVTSISDYAFKSLRSIDSIVIPDSVTSIGKDAFNYCDSLSNVTIGNNVTSIDSQAFMHCEALSNITIPGKVTNMGYGVFSNCSSLTNATFLNGITNIGSATFLDCTNLQSVTIPDSVTNIGSSVFYKCSNLSNIIIPKSVANIGGGAFYYCSSLTNIIIPNGVSKILESTFAYCNSLTSITIPNSVTSIKNEAFYECDNLANVIIGNSLTFIGFSAFYDCDNLTSITIPKTIKTICERAFQGCENLTTVYYSGTKEEWLEIDKQAFNGDLSGADLIYNYNISVNSALNSSSNVAVLSGSAQATKTINYATKGCYYVIMAVNNKNASDLLSESNLLFIDQKIAESATLKFNVILPDSVKNYDLVIASNSVDKPEVFSILAPSISTVTYGDSIVLHADFEGEIPVGMKVVWSADNTNFTIVEKSEDGTTCTVTPASSGDTVFTATVVDTDGNIVATDTQSLTSKAGFFQKIIAFFKKLFGMTKIIPEIFKF